MFVVETGNDPASDVLPEVVVNVAVFATPAVVAFMLTLLAAVCVPEVAG